jgi:hypothetical protein
MKNNKKKIGVINVFSKRHWLRHLAISTIKFFLLLLSLLLLLLLIRLFILLDRIISAIDIT